MTDRLLEGVPCLSELSLRHFGKGSGRAFTIMLSTREEKPCPEVVADILAAAIAVDQSSLFSAHVAAYAPPPWRQADL